MSNPSFYRSARSLSGLVLIAALVAACAGNASPVPASAGTSASTPAYSATTVSPPSISPGASPLTTSSTDPNVTRLVGIFVTKLGSVLEVGDGQMLYVHAGDSATASTCLDACATAWPPFLLPAGAKIVSPPGAHGSFGAITRPDGSSQATYKDKPLYFWQANAGPGDVGGQGINGFSVANP